ncbi:MAG: tetratricopeptide repeat protein [Pseudomonadota bacterium]|nr:tetratricopeptide repeat protein [Pseudomonadota bacterium]MDE3038186.1 tetratricopeptide repeat protein [Pseudomonadota bacterium]
MSELFNEIEEDIRQEHFDQLWRRFGKMMVAASAVVVLTTVGMVLEKNHRQAQAMAQTAKFITGVNRLDTGDYAAAAAVFSTLAEDETSPYYGPAMLRKAQAQTAGGDKAGAAKTYAALATHGGEFSALALLLAPETMGNLPVPDRAAAFYFTQSEQKGWQLLKQGNKAAAIGIFLSLRDDAGAPYTQRQRMREALQYLAPEKGAAHD